MVQIRPACLSIFYLTFICFGSNNFAQGSQTLRVLITKTEGDVQVKWTNYLKKLEKSAGLTFQVFSTRSKYSSGDFLQLCKDKMYDLCLVMKSSSHSLPLSEDIQLLSPALVFAKGGGFKTNFTHVFHSSVWSFLLLAILLSIGLLAGFEFLHPFGFRLHRYWNYELASKLTFSEAALHIFGGLFLKTPSKRPVSLAGSILGLFWAAFSLCIVSLFIAGTTISVFASPRVSGLWLSALPRDAAPSASCSVDDLFCGLARGMACPGGPQSRTCRILRDLRPSSDAADALWRRVASGEVGLVTDSLAASQLVQRGANLSAVLLGPPIASLAFSASSESLLPSINRGVLGIREQAGVPDVGGAGAVSGPLVDQLAAALPIRLSMAAGVFVLLLMGAVVALVALLSEFVMRTFVTKDHKKLDTELQQGLPNETRV